MSTATANAARSAQTPKLGPSRSWTSHRATYSARWTASRDRGRAVRGATTRTTPATSSASDTAHSRTMPCASGAPRPTSPRSRRGSRSRPDAGAVRRRPRPPGSVIRTATSSVTVERSPANHPTFPPIIRLSVDRPNDCRLQTSAPALALISRPHSIRAMLKSSLAARAGCSAISLCSVPSESDRILTPGVAA